MVVVLMVGAGLEEVASMEMRLAMWSEVRVRGDGVGMVEVGIRSMWDRIVDSNSLNVVPRLVREVDLNRVVVGRTRERVVQKWPGKALM